MRLRIAIFLLTTLSPLLTYSATISLPADADTSIFQNFPGNNMGAFTDFAAGNTGNGGNSRGLIRFNLSSIPTNASITSVSVALTVTKKSVFGGAASTFNLHRALN